MKYTSICIGNLQDSDPKKPILSELSLDIRFHQKKRKHEIADSLCKKVGVVLIKKKSKGFSKACN